MRTTGPWSSASYGANGRFRGEVVSINDPLRRNRVQVRIFGYQDDEGTIPKDKLEWVHVAQNNSQLPGATSTHSYYPGAQVILDVIGTEIHVTGAIAGFDGDQKQREGKIPDTPKIVQGEKKKTGTATDGEGKDAILLERDPKVDEPIKDGKEKKAYDYAKNDAPYEKGDAAKFPDLKSIAFDKLGGGSDVLNVIRQLDGNISGAIKSAIDIIRNLRMNGFGTSKDTIGSGLVNEAANQFVNDYGSVPNLEIVGILHELATTAKLVKNMTPTLLRTYMQDGTLNRFPGSLSPAILGVDEDTILALRGIQALLQGPVGSDLTLFIDGIRTHHQSGVHQALASVMEYLNELAVSAGGPGGLARMFDPPSLVQLTTDVTSLGTYAGVSQDAIGGLAGGLIGQILRGGPQAVSEAQAKGSGNSSQQIQKLAALLNMFQGNPVAMSEIMSGGLNPQSLSKIVLKYVPKPTNHPQKRFPG